MVMIEQISRYEKYEDEAILDGRRRGLTFGQIARNMPGRTAKGIAERCRRLGLKPAPKKPKKISVIYEHSVFRFCLRCRTEFEAETTPDGRLIEWICMPCKRSKSWQSAGSSML